jgi:hypothetical protein
VNFQGRMSEVEPAKVMRSRREVVTGVNFAATEASSSGEACAADLMG